MTVAKADIDRIADHVLEIFPSLDETEQKLSLAIYRLLAEGEPVALARLAEAAGVSEEQASRILEKWPGVYSDDDGAIIGYWGLALPKMGHDFVVDGRHLYTWCAWDNLFLPELLGKTAEVASKCPVTGTEIRLTVAPEGVRRVEPAATVLSFVAPDPDAVSADVISSFCHYIYFFASAEAGSGWVEEHPGTFLLSIEEGVELARRKNAGQYPAILG